MFALVLAALLVTGISSADAAIVANRGAQFSGSTTAGSTVTVQSTFTNPWGAGYYMVDTELFNANNARVAQFAEKVWLDYNQSTTRTYSWQTGSTPAGSYRAAQGLFTDGWKQQIEWRNNAGSVELTATAPWVLSASATTSGTAATINSSFKAPVAGTYLLNTEIYDRYDSRVAQWYQERSMRAGATVQLTYSWNGKSGTTYRVSQGAFTPKWEKILAWSKSTASFTTTATTTTTAPTTTTTSPPPTITTTTAASPNPSNNVLAGMTFYGSNAGAAAVAESWKSSRPADAALMARLAVTPSAIWLGDWSGDVTTTTNDILTRAAAAGKTPVLVVYNIPKRDCGQYSAGGKITTDAYNAWVSGIAQGIKGRPAVFILEPDALGVVECLSATELEARYLMLAQATKTLRAAGGHVYIEASTWVDTATMSNRLKQSDVAVANGFALNVSAFNSTASMVNYGTQLSQAVGGKHFVIDTSRNGLGSNGEWCNPSGRAVGSDPTTQTGSTLVDAYLWIKTPGESDGTCNGGPTAGIFWPEYGLGLAKRAWQ